MGAHVYILLCADKSFYVGCATEAISPSGSISTIRDIFPVTLIRDDRLNWLGLNISIGSPMRSQPKDRSKVGGRAKKQALIRSDWETVQNFASRRGGQPKQV
ncbi:putative endonuclease [Afipia massiliensis]|uniref:Putative endonuclease n=1 Tax=Afipia massiliensis TaxID=211460 RepID=A0A840N8V2_9BRAD|nr:putative endonuclease [Afipia massiliensis]